MRFLEHHNNNSIITVITLSGCITVIQSGTLENESLFEYEPNKMILPCNRAPKTLCMLNYSCFACSGRRSAR